MNIAEQETLEIEYWKNAEYESSNNFGIYTLAHKFIEARIFLDKINEHKQSFENAKVILEVGAGQGWASCILKKMYPQKQIYCSDISQYALESLKHWEEIFKVKIDKKIVCKSYEIPLENESIDTIFCFQSAHHFRRHNETLKEVYRLLKTGGECLYLHEPSCKKYIYKLAHKRVNARRAQVAQVAEDILIYDNIVQLAKNIGFINSKVQFAPTTTNRAPFETIYYYILQKLKFLQKLLPCTADYIFSKKV